MAESSFAMLKTELLHRRALPTREQARVAIYDYIEGCYNRRRRHSAFDYLSPAECEGRRAATAAASCLRWAACISELCT